MDSCYKITEAGKYVLQLLKLAGFKFYLEDQIKKWNEQEHVDLEIKPVIKSES